ncbi:hypothetical protein [Salana multivorans]
MSCSRPPAGQPIVVELDVLASYQQIELDPGELGNVPRNLDAGLALTLEESLVVILTVPVHTDTVHVRCEVGSSAPELEDWECAVELSLLCGPEIVISGWAGSDAEVVRLPQSGWHRVRYVVPDGQAWHDADGRGEEYPGRCLLQLWPAPPTDPTVLASQAPWSQYWTFGTEARDAVAVVRSAHPADQLIEVINVALARHPEVARRIAAGDLRYQSGVIRYVQELRRGPGAHDPDEVERLITDRAQLAGHEPPQTGHEPPQT